MDFIRKLKEEIQKYSRMEDFLDEHYNEEEYENIYFVETLSTDEYRWYILENNVYKIKVDSEDYYFGICEVGTLKSESMDVSDTYHKMEMFEVEKIVRETFRKKE